MGIKFFECAICKGFFFNNIRSEKRFISDKRGVRYHLQKIHHINRQAGSPKHKGNRTTKNKGIIGDKIQDNRSKVTQNCILYKEF